MVQAQMIVCDEMGILKEFNKLPSEDQVWVMHGAWLALKIVPERNKTTCIAIAMDFRELKPGVWIKG